MTSINLRKSDSYVDLALYLDSRKELVSKNLRILNKIHGNKFAESKEFLKSTLDRMMDYESYYSKLESELMDAVIREKLGLKRQSDASIGRASYQISAKKLKKETLKKLYFPRSTFILFSNFMKKVTRKSLELIQDLEIKASQNSGDDEVTISDEYKVLKIRKFYDQKSNRRFVLFNLFIKLKYAIKKLLNKDVQNFQNATINGVWERKNSYDHISLELTVNKVKETKGSRVPVSTKAKVDVQLGPYRSLVKMLDLVTSEKPEYFKKDAKNVVIAFNEAKMQVSFSEENVKRMKKLVYSELYPVFKWYFLNEPEAYFERIQSGEITLQEISGFLKLKDSKKLINALIEQHGSKVRLKDLDPSTREKILNVIFNDLKTSANKLYTTIHGDKIKRLLMERFRPEVRYEFVFDVRDKHNAKRYGSIGLVFFGNQQGMMPAELYAVTHDGAEHVRVAFL